MDFIWATMKNWFAEENVTFKLNDVTDLDIEECAVTSKGDWKHRYDATG
jgi:hypothetical protein